MPPFPIPTLVFTAGFISFFIALRITIRDAEDTYFSDFLKVLAFSATTALSIRIWILFILAA